MYFYVIQTVFKLFKNHKNQRSQIVLNFILKILQSAKNQTGSIFFHLKIAQLYIIMYFYVIQTVFKPFKNHKNQRSQIMLDFILKIYNLLNIKPDRYFFTPKQSVIYNYVFLCYLDLFSNYLKIIKIKDRRLCWNFILKILQSAEQSNRIDIF